WAPPYTWPAMRPASPPGRSSRSTGEPPSHQPDGEGTGPAGARRRFANLLNLWGLKAGECRAGRLLPPSRRAAVTWLALFPPPSEHGDPVIDRMPVEWRHTRAPYGPAFLAVAAAPSALGARSALAFRLWFQGLAALAAGLGLLLLTRRGAGPGRLAVLALNPL